MTEVLGIGYLSNMLCEGAFLDETLRIKKKRINLQQIIFLLLFLFFMSLPQTLLCSLDPIALVMAVTK